MTRRDFVQSAAAGVTLLVGRSALGQAAGGGKELKVGIVGVGNQGRVLIRDTRRIAKREKNVRFTAVCDIWPWAQRYASRRLKAYKMPVNTYTDLGEMLAKEKDLDAVIVSVPDFFHADYTIACLEAGKHVYCEKEMSNELPNAAKMVAAARKAGKLLQIGHQRRSNPVYSVTLDAIRKGEICGRLTNCYGQWARPVQSKLTWPEKYEIPKATLAKYGYKSMEEFRNWRWYRKYSAGPIADLGSHQIDMFSWFLHAEPTSLMAVAGKDYYKDREWYEDVLVMYEYATKAGSARAFYQVLNTNGYGHYYERFRGDKGTLTISENPKKCYYVPEPAAELPEWMSGVETEAHDGHENAVPLMKALPNRNAAAKAAMERWGNMNPHEMHLENFYNAVRANDKSILTCPGEVAYPTAVAVLSVIPAIEAGGKRRFTEADYKA